MTALRDQLKAGLSASHGQGAEGGPTVAEIAAQVKALKAAHNIEATPQRVRQKHSAAEEPVTARIRRRAEAAPTSDQANGHDIAPEIGAGMDAALSKNSPDKSLMPFQKRMAMQQRSDEGSSLPPL